MLGVRVSTRTPLRAACAAPRRLQHVHCRERRAELGARACSACEGGGRFCRRVARSLAGALVDVLLDDRSRDSEQIVLPVRLQVRQSTGAAPPTPEL